MQPESIAAIRAAGSAELETIGQDTRPVVHLRPGDASITDRLEQALADANLGLYAQAGRIVRVVPISDPPSGRIAPRRQSGTPVIRPVETPTLAEFVRRAARVVRFDGRAKKDRETDAPERELTILAARGFWRFPVLAGVVTGPTLRPDGTIIDRRGYDEATGLLFHDDGTPFPAVPERPTREHARAAYARLAAPFAEFPFLGESDRTAFLAAILSVVGRPAIEGPAPIFLIRATAPGTGKSLLADGLAMIATGRRAARWSAAGSEEEERKRLLAIALDGDALVLIDNVEQPLGSGVLAGALTSCAVKDRILGSTRTVEAPFRPVLIATGNNLQTRGDLSRRAVPIDLDARMERPETRDSFRIPDLVAHLRAERPQLVADALTLLRAYVVAGKPSATLPAFGSFEEWSGLVRSALVWAGGADPCAGRERIRLEADPEVEAISELLTAWRAAYGDRPTTAAQLSGFSESKGPSSRLLYVALQAFCGPGDVGSPRPARLGLAFRKWRDRPIGGLALRRVRDESGHRGGASWWVESLSDVGDDGGSEGGTRTRCSEGGAMGAILADRQSGPPIIPHAAAGAKLA